jgi:acyl-CoA synthetase (AMP-forming)/AMP-acid ligase II
MIITGGYNVYPTEVENAMSALPGVAEVAVVGLADETWGEAISAFVVVRAGCELAENEIVDACLARLAAYKKPRRVQFVDHLPKTGSGKIRRRALRDSAALAGG